MQINLLQLLMINNYTWLHIIKRHKLACMLSSATKQVSIIQLPDSLCTFRTSMIIRAN
jgi:hypothetical protein